MQNGSFTKVFFALFLCLETLFMVYFRLNNKIKEARKTLPFLFEGPRDGSTFSLRNSCDNEMTSLSTIQKMWRCYFCDTFLPLSPSGSHREGNSRALHTEGRSMLFLFVLSPHTLPFEQQFSHCCWGLAVPLPGQDYYLATTYPYIYLQILPWQLALTFSCLACFTC